MKSNKVEFYGITGKKGHGKNTLAEFIIKYNNKFQLKQFGDGVKSYASKIFNIPLNDFYDRNQKDKKFERGRNLDEYLFNMREATKLDLKDKNLIAYSPREILQLFGTDYVRNTDPNFWISVLDRNLDPNIPTIIADVRFLNECEYLRNKFDAKIIKIQLVDENEDNSVKPHLSETELEEIDSDMLFIAKYGNFSLHEEVAKYLAEGWDRPEQK